MKQVNQLQTKETVLKELENVANRAEEQAFSSHSTDTKSKYYDYAHGIRVAILYVKTIGQEVEVWVRD